jgi:hypothetical protein
MEQFTVPQFIDVEDKVVGPLSARQFLILLAGGGMSFLYYKMFIFIYFLVFSILTVILAAVFTFVKVAGVPFHYFILNFAQALRFPGVRVWARDLAHDFPENVEVELYRTEAIPDKSLSSSHLNQLALIVDTRGYYSGEDDEIDIFNEKHHQPSF